MSLYTLDEWIDRIAGQHRQGVDLSLERVSSVASDLYLTDFICPVVTVGGTNGKGSTVAALEAVWLAAGYRVGAFTSPWLYRFNELIRVQGELVSDECLTAAFAKIEAARGVITLTIFEFNTLAALLIFKEAGLDVVILEVGLGGRLDAVNILSADVAVVTSIALDHMDWLGDTREAIATEKAGIFRTGHLAVCGDPAPPATLRVPGVPLLCIGQDFGFLDRGIVWDFWCQDKQWVDLPKPALLLQNMASALQTVEWLQRRLPVTEAAVRTALKILHLPGRIEVRPGEVTEIRDVSHNPAAVAELGRYLSGQCVTGRTRAVFSMLADKDITGTLQVIAPHIDEWFSAPLDVARAADIARLQADFDRADIRDVSFFASVQQAYQAVRAISRPGDRIVIFGSFYTVSVVGKAE